MAIVWMTSDAYHSDAVATDAGFSEQFVRDGWWQDALHAPNRPTYYPTDGPFGTGAWAHGRYADGNSRIRLPSAVGATFIVGAWFNHIGSNANCVAIRLGNDSNTQTTIFFESTGTISYRRNATTLGTSTEQFSFGRWNHIAVKTLINDTTGTVDIELNGVSILSLTSQDTYEGSAGAEVTWVEFYGDDNWYLRWSQPFVASATGDAPTDLFGMHKVWALRPTGDGTPTDWTTLGAGTNAAEVNEVEADDDTSYNYASTSTNEDRLTLGDLPETPDTIYAVQSRVLVKQTDAGNLGLKNGVYVGTTKSVSAERKCSINWDYHTNLFTLNPDDSAAWAEADVNGTSIVYEVG